MTAVILPNGVNVFLDANGLPLASGTVGMYIPSTLTPKDTWTNAAQTVLNTNPITLDAAGRAIIYGVGAYRQIVNDSLGNLQWDQPTASPSGGGASGGPNTTIASSSTTDLGTAGSLFVTISGTATINSFGSSADINSPLYFIVFSGALTLVNSGALVLPGAQNISTLANDFAVAQYLGSGNWQILQYVRSNGQILSLSGTDTTIASATTTDIGSKPTNLVTITGTTTITGLGSSASTANPLYVIRFTGALTLTNNNTSLILPGGGNISTMAGDTMLAEYLGSSNWQVLAYWKGPSGAAGGTSSGIIADARNSVVKFLSNTTLTITADQVIAYTAFSGSGYIGNTLSFTLNFGSTGANGLDTGSIGASTFYAIYIIYNPVGNTWASLASLNLAYAPTLPSGYTAMALVAVVPTNGASQVVPGYVAYGKSCWYQPIQIFTAHANSLSLISQSLAVAVPSIAKTVSGILGSTSGGGAFAAASDSSATGLQHSIGVPLGTAQLLNYGAAMSFIGIALVTSQVVYWLAEPSGVQMHVVGFSI